MANWKPTTVLAHKRRCNRLARELGLMKPDTRNTRGEATYAVPVDKFPPVPLPDPFASMKQDENPEQYRRKVLGGWEFPPQPLPRP